MPTTEKARDSGQTLCMLASLLVFGATTGLILLSVFLFPEQVDAGPLQVSMMLATLFAPGTMFLAFVYLNRKTLPANKDAQAACGVEAVDADLSALQLSA